VCVLFLKYASMTTQEKK